MKKIFGFVAVAAAAVVTLTSCPGPKPQPDQDGSIKVKYPAREIAIGDEIKVDVTVTPAGTKLKYTSSDPSVASVTTFGIINGLEAGATTIVVEAEGINKKDSMTVYVREASQLFKLGGFTLWKLDKTTTLSDRRDSVLLSDGTKPVCKICPAEWHVWDNNLSFDSKKGTISGAGYVIILENVPTFVIEDDNYEGGKYNGYYIGTGSIKISSTATNDSVYMIKPGKILDATKWADYLEGVDTTLKISECIYDQAMHYIDYTNQKAYYYQAFVGEGIIKGDDAAVQYKQTIDWSTGVYGLEFNEADTAFARPAKIALESIYYESWEDEEEEEAPAVIKRFVAPRNDFKISKDVKTLDRFYMKK